MDDLANELKHRYRPDGLAARLDLELDAIKLPAHETTCCHTVGRTGHPHDNTPRSPLSVSRGRSNARFLTVLTLACRLFHR